MNPEDQSNYEQIHSFIFVEDNTERTPQVRGWIEAGRPLDLTKRKVEQATWPITILSKGNLKDQSVPIEVIEAQMSRSSR